jgi:hypothetical protein
VINVISNIKHLLDTAIVAQEMKNAMKELETGPNNAHCMILHSPEIIA